MWESGLYLMQGPRWGLSHHLFHYFTFSSPSYLPDSLDLQGAWVKLQVGLGKREAPAVGPGEAGHFWDLTRDPDFSYWGDLKTIAAIPWSDLGFH